jgi:hypothetical protein
LRHASDTTGTKAGVDLKTLSTLMSHAGTGMMEGHVHVEGDLAHLAEAAKKVAKGATGNYQAGGNG